MKRLSQTWKHKKNVNTKLSNTSTTSSSKELVFGQKNLQNDGFKGGFKSPATTHLTNPATLRQTKTPQNDEIPGVSKNSPYLISPNGSLGVSFGFDFDAAALSEMDRLEQEHIPSSTTTPIPHKRRCRLTEKRVTSTPLENFDDLLQKSSSAVTTTPFGAHSRALKARQRISTPIDETGHGLVSPTADLPTFSPVNLTASVVFNEGCGTSDSERIGRREQSNQKVLTTTTCSESERINGQNHDNQKLSLSNSDTSSKSSESASSTASILEIEPSSGGDVLNLSSWGLPPPVLQRYHDMGITHMFEWQAECLRTGHVLRGGNLVYSAPTSAGKTMVAELLMLKRVLETQRKALFILPYVSVAREKMFYLQRLFQEASVRVEGFMGSHSPAGGFAAVDIAVCTIEKANSLLNRLLEENKVSTLGVVVVDEMHLIGDAHRGYLLELFLTKILFVTGKGKVEDGPNDDDKVPETAIQIVSMSATLPNLDMLAHWLKADLYFTNYRPVPLTEMVKVGPTIYDNTMKKIRDIDPATAVAHDDDHVIPLCKETISGGHSVLIFCPTKNWCEKQAEAIARHFASIGRLALATNNDRKAQKPGFVKASDLIAFDVEAIKEVLEQLRRTPVGLDSVMKRIIPYSVAYHHAGLTVDERDIIEGAFRQGTIRVLVATSTLCSGVNLPARRVIIRTPTFHGKMIDPLVYKQMAGRAGRKGVDDLGESILVCKAIERHKATTLMKSELKAVQSCLLLKEQNGGIKRALLEVIASGVVTGLRDVERYAACTFFASSSSENDVSGSKSAITETIRFLVENEFIRVQVMKYRKANDDKEEEEECVERYVPTQLGGATVASALSPDEALVVFAELQKARKCFVLESELHIIYQVTPIYVETQWPNLDWNQFLSIWERLPSNMRRVADIVGIQEVYLSLASRGRIPTRTPQHRQQLRVHRRFFAALALQDLVHEVPLNVVASRYGATRGMVQSLQGSASTFAGMVTVFCQRLGWQNLDLLLSQFQSRLSFGVERELCDLVRISVLNAARARMLYNAGFQTIASLASAKAEEVETVLRNAVPFVSGRKHLGETDLEVRHRKEARVFWVAGKRGLSEKEAAELIVTEAKRHLQSDVAQLGIAWKAPQPPVSSTANGKADSQSSRNAGGSTRVESATGKKRKNTGRRRSSGSHRKSRKSPPSRHRQKSPVLNTIKSPFSNNEDKIAKTATIHRGTGQGEDVPSTSAIPEETRRMDNKGEPAMEIQKGSTTLTCKDEKRNGETEIKMVSAVGQMSTNFQGSKNLQSACFRGFAQGQGNPSSSSGAAQTADKNYDANRVDGISERKSVEENELIDRGRREMGTKKNSRSTEKNCKAALPRDSGHKLPSGNVVNVYSSTGNSATASSSKESPTKGTKTFHHQEHHRNIRTMKSNNQVPCKDYGISTFLSRDPVTTNQNTGNLFKDKLKGSPNMDIHSRRDRNLLSRDKVVTNQNAGNFCHDKVKGSSTREEVFIAKEDKQAIGQEENEKTRKTGCFGVPNTRRNDSIKKKTNCSLQRNNLETESAVEMKARKTECDNQVEKRSEAMDILCSLTSKTTVQSSTPNSPTSTNERRSTERCDVFPVNEAKSSNKRRSPRSGQGDESPKEKFPRREEEDADIIVFSESIPRQKESSLSTTQSFSVQEESCSSAVLFDNSADVSESRPHQPQGATTSPELYSEPLEEETTKPSSDERRKNGEVFESQALGFSMSDSYLAQCGGFTQMEPCTVADATKQRSPAIEQLEFDGISSISDDVMAQHCDIISQAAIGQDVYDQEVIDQEEDGPNIENTETEDVSEDGFVQESVHAKRANNADQATDRNQGFKECNDDVIGEFDSCNRYQSTGRFIPSEPSFSAENTCSLSMSSIASTSKPNDEQNGEEEGLENSGSFSLNLSLSESIGDETDLVVAKDPEKSDGKKVLNQLINKHRATCCHDQMKLLGNEKSKKNEVATRAVERETIEKYDGRSSMGKNVVSGNMSIDMIGMGTETLDEKNYVREGQFTKIKSKNNDIIGTARCGSENSCHTTPKRNQEESLQSRNLVVETPESDEGSQVTHSNQISDSTTGSPCVDSPASPSCTFTSVSIIDVSANDLLFHTFVKEWKTRKEFSLAIGCERLLDNVPKIGGRFNKGPPIAKGTSKGLPIEGTDEVVVGVAVCWSGKDAYYVSLKECDDVISDGRSHDESVVAPDLSVATRIEGIKSVLEYRGKRKGMKFCFDSTALYKVLAQSSGITLSGEIEDPKIAAWLLDPSSKEKTLHQLVGEFISDKTGLLEGIGAGFGNGGFGLASQCPASGRARSCTEAVIVYWSMKQLRLNLEKDSLDKAFYQVEMPVMKCLARMELNGIGFSDLECDRLKSILQAKLRTLEEEAYRLANHSFSLTSPDEVAMVLFVELKLPADGKQDDSLPAKRRTLGSTRRASLNGGKRGRKLLKHLSTNKDVLERLKPMHPLPGVILEWRRINCALTKVVYPLQREKQLNSRLNMSRIYPTSQTHTATGRVSFAEPNLQNVPRDFEIDLPTVIAESPPQGAQSTNRGYRKVTHGNNAPGAKFAVSMRTAFIPFKGGILLAADYSQLELRLIAHLSRDERLLKLLNTGGDVFRMIAGSLNGIERAAVSDVQRQRAKQICYGIIYGIGAKSLGEQLGLSEEDASVYIEKFKSRFSGIKKYLKTTVEGCRKNGFVVTVSNRRRYLPAINSTNVHARSQAERQAVNTTVQGSAADLVKIAMINIDRKLTEIYSSCRRTHRHKNNEKDELDISRRKSTRISAQAPRRGSSAQSIQGAHVVLQLHDELILEVAEEDLDRVAAIVKKEMENAIKLSVVLPVKLKAGPSWGTMNPLES